MKAFLPPCDHCGFPVDLRPGTPVHVLPVPNAAGVDRPELCQAGSYAGTRSATVKSVRVRTVRFSGGSVAYSLFLDGVPRPMEFVVWQHADGVTWSGWRVELIEGSGPVLVPYDGRPATARPLLEQMPDLAAYWLADTIEPF